jgi:CO dehydrogenase maturation factor
MKIAICGKGGSGKSSITALLARYLSGRGCHVLVVDADESNMGLHRLLGVESPVILLDHLGGKKAFKQKINQKFPPPEGVVFGDKIPVSSLPAECVAIAGNIRLIAVGKIHVAGEGCACSIGLLSKMVLSKLDLDEKEIVLIDTEAGVEHFGRDVDAGCDMIFAVVDPAYESFLLAGKIKTMAEASKAEIFFILNKTDDRSRSVMESHLDRDKIIAAVPASDGLFLSSLEGKPLQTAVPEIAAAGDLIINRLSAKRP